MRRALVVPLALLALLAPASCRSQDPSPAPGEGDAAPAQDCSVEGCVERPGRLSLAGQRTVLEALQVAGPIAGRSDLSRVQLVRGSEPALVITIDVASMLASGDSSRNVLLLPGDVLRVPELAPVPASAPAGG